MRGAHPERRVERTIADGDAIRLGERLLIGCSGGPDSVALAAALHAIASEMDLDLQMAHVNHQVRNSAWQDECVAAGVAAALELPLHCLRLPASADSEAAMRDGRYEVLEATARRIGATTVAVAHNAEDQSETVLLALFRGAGPLGLSGMRARRPLCADIDLARPVLPISSADLRRYCHVRGLPYAVDPTNADFDRRRNAVRRLLTSMRPHFAGMDAAIARSAALDADERDGHARSGVRRRIRERLADENQLRDVDFAHIEAVARAVAKGGSGTFYMKPGIALTVVCGEIAGITRQ